MTSNFQLQQYRVSYWQTPWHLPSQYRSDDGACIAYLGDLAMTLQKALNDRDAGDLNMTEEEIANHVRRLQNAIETAWRDMRSLIAGQARDSSNEFVANLFALDQAKRDFSGERLGQLLGWALGEDVRIIRS